MDQNSRGTMKIQGNFSGWRKLKLLMWKNFKLQSRNKVQTIVEILIPIFFILALVYLRTVVPVKRINEPTIFEPFQVRKVPKVLKTATNKIYYTPNATYWQKIMRSVDEEFFITRRLKYTFVSFASESEMVFAYEQSMKSLSNSSRTSTTGLNVTSPVLAGIVFPAWDGSVNSSETPLNYKLRFPAYQRSEFDIFSERLSVKPSWFSDTLYPIFLLPGPRSSKNTGGFPGYFEEGFLYLQNAIESTVIKSFLNESQKTEIEQYNLNLQRFPYPAYSKDGFLFALQFWFSFFLVFSFIYPAMNITKMIVHEKECRLKETMKTMGLPNWLHWTAWFIKAFVLTSLSMALDTILFKIRFVDGKAIMTETNGVIIFLVLLCHSVTIIGYSFLMSTLFSSANTAATTAGFGWVIVYMPFSFAFPRINVMTRSTKYWTSFFFGNVPLCFACYIFSIFEGTGSGVQWESLTKGVTPDDSFSIFDCMLMMLVNAAIYMIAGFYIELVWPGKYGVPLPWCFPFTKWYWTDGIQGKSSTKDKSNNVPDQDFRYFEADPKYLNAGIEIRGLSKTFGSKSSVTNLNIKFYENQVTALLGHNGAGKTTTMSMLTGLITPTSGTAIVNGYDICKDMGLVRGSLGLCPQHNVLFDDLTVEEHIKFFALLKGYNDVGADEEVKQMIQSLGFESKAQALAGSLSGGMKRKLSIGIAFCAGSKVVFLDEPTSGMDPGTRRSTWDLIQREKLNRTVILSTHYMDEADLLGDRIAIMKEGRIECCGRSLFLKKQFGGCHNLVIVKEPNCIVSTVTEFLEQRISGIKIKENVGAELSYSLPDEHSSVFPSLFEALEEQKKMLGIDSFGVHNTSMGQVFTRVIHPDFGSDSTKQTHLNEEGPEVPMLPKTMEIDGPRLKSWKLYWQQFKTTLKKKMLYAIRNRGLASLQIFIPAVVTGYLMFSLKTVPGLNTPLPLRLSLDNYEVYGHTTTPTSCEPTHKICNGFRNYIGRKHHIENITTDTDTLENFYLHKATENLGATESRYMIGLEEQFSKNISGKSSRILTAFFNNQPFHNPPLALNSLSNGILRAFRVQLELSVTNHPFDYNDVDSSKQTGNLFTIGFMAGWCIQFSLGIMGASMIIFMVYERTVGAKHLQFVKGLKFPIYWAGMLVMDMINYLIPCILIALILISMNVQQFRQFPVIFWFLILCLGHGWSMAGMMSLFSFAFTIPSSGFARMMLQIFALGVGSIVIVALIQTPEYELGDLAETLHNVFLVIPNYAAGMGIVQVTSHYDLQEYCGYFNLDSLCKLDENFVCCTKYQEHYFSWKSLGIGKNLLSLFLTGLACFLGVYIIESHILSKIRSKFQRTVRVQKTNSTEKDIMDEDVEREEDRIRQQTLRDLSQTDNLVLRNLTKTYGQTLTAVNSVSLGVAKGETFGLLGVNGAGKTTTFQMLTGKIPITSGDAYIFQHSVSQNLSQVYQNLGYCPQFDAQIEQLTGRETLQMYANLKGIEEKHIPRIVQSLAENLLFSEHIDQQVGNYRCVSQELMHEKNLETKESLMKFWSMIFYSGGNKRKLSTAVAMLGNPSVIILDEPTNGMDPLARRQVWNALSRLRELGTSVVISSHSMEECEALCSKVAIMVNGKFRCLGSPQHLKSKFGEGYTIIAQLNYTSHHNAPKSDDVTWDEELQRFSSYIKSEFPNCELRDTHCGFVEYHIPGRDIKWAKLFKTMEQAKSSFSLQAYSVGQTSLEQVFHKFTEQQESFGF